MKNTISFLFFLFYFFVLQSVAQNYISIQGKVVEVSTQKEIPYAHISFDKMGTLANEKGVFTLRLLSLSNSMTILVSCLGYEDKLLPLPKDLSMLWVISLVPSRVNLPEVFVTPIDASSIFTKFVTNYQTQNKPEALKIETFLRGYLVTSVLPYQLNKSTIVYESNIDFTIYHHNQDKPYDNRVQINKDIYKNVKDLHIFDGIYPINVSTENIFIPNFNYLVSIAYMRKHPFFQKNNIKKYTFELDSIYTSNNINIYKISFKYKNINNKEKLGKGSIWIQDSTYQIQKIVFEKYSYDKKNELSDDKIEIYNDYLYEIIYYEGKPIYVSSTGKNKKVTLKDTINTKKRHNKTELFIFNEKPTEYNASQHQSINYEDISYFSLSSNQKKGEYNYSQIPNQDWENQFTTLKNIEIKDSISYILDKSSRIACKIQNAEYNISYNGKRLMDNYSLDSLEKSNYYNFNGSCIFERTPYGFAGSNFITKGNQFTIIHLGKDTWVGTENTKVLQKIDIMGERKIEYTHFNEILFPPLLKPAVYFNELFDAIKIAKIELLPSEKYNGEICHKISIEYIGNHTINVKQEKQIIWIRQKDYMPICLEWHINKKLNNSKKIDIRIFGISNLKYNQSDFSETFQKAIDLSNYKINTESIKKIDMYDEMVKQGVISQKFADRMRKKKAKIEKKAYKKGVKKVKK